MQDCLSFLDHIHGYADKAGAAFEKGTLKDGLKGISKIAHMIHMIRSSESRCGALPADWDTLNEMSEAWRNPKDVEFGDEGLLVHGVNITKFAGETANAWDNKDYEKVGYEIGRASLSIVHNGKLIDLGQDVG